MADRSTIPRERRVRITEVYASVQGESTHVGKPCVFVRLTGCPLRCSWCDSEFTFTGGQVRDLEQVASEAHAFGIHTVEVTGGEPLVQPTAIPLMARLLELGHEVLLETSGALPIAAVPEGVHVIMDLKAPGSGEEGRNRLANLDELRATDEIKIVLADRADYEWARDLVRRHDLGRRHPVLLSPAWGMVEPRDLADWLVEDRLPARMQLQLHKVVWPADARGV
jgi:7-carboxy-7-deazaguanine synthase